MRLNELQMAVTQLNIVTKTFGPKKEKSFRYLMVVVVVVVLGGGLYVEMCCI
jgi:hypothetical protein